VSTYNSVQHNLFLLQVTHAADLCLLLDYVMAVVLVMVRLMLVVTAHYCKGLPSQRVAIAKKYRQKASLVLGLGLGL